jgi:uroporphyrinogen decarboxylase
MNSHRDLFRCIMHYGSFDRMPVVHWGAWPETVERWRREGLPAESEETHRFLGTTPHWAFIRVDLGLLPPLDEILLEETLEYQVVRGADGVVFRSNKGESSIPHYVDFSLKGPGDWEEYKKRLQPHPDRLPPNLDQMIENAKASGLALCFDTGSLMGWIRNWMGVENMSYLICDHPDVYADMVMTLAEVVCWGIDAVLPKVQVDFGFGWEDICGKSGPFVSPSVFVKSVGPGYRKIRERLERYGVRLYGIDSDGDVSALAKHWLDAGVNLLFPIEVGTWKGDANAYRRRYGKELRIIGNFDKLALEHGRIAVEAELERLLPLMREGGFMIMPDHLITPGVALDDYRWYLNRLREIRL